jgi:hypothetical protein
VVAEIVLVIAAGNGDASAKNGFTPAKICRAGVLTALPPFPRRPDRYPTIRPMHKMAI